MTTQTAFHNALRDAAQPIPKGLLDKTGAPAGKRFAVYRNNVAVSLIEALREGFPATSRLLGDGNFNALSRQFVQAHAPDSPLMFLYGAEFPAFLSGVQPLAHLGYLPQVAALEWQVRLAYHAADAASLAPETLQALPPEALLAARFVFAPAVRLVRSDHPIADIRAFALGDGPAPAGGAQAVLITRPQYDPELTPLPPAQATLMQALLDGMPLGDALDVAPDADLPAALGLILTQNALTAIR